MNTNSTIYDLEVNTGFRCVWDDVGEDVSEERSIEDVLIASDLDWSVSKLPIVAERKNLTGLQQFTVPGRVGIVRNDLGVCLTVVNEDADIIQNDAGFNLLDQIRETGVADYFRAGSLHMGLKPWVIMKGNESVIVNGSKYESFLVITLTHDKEKHYIAQHVFRRVGSETLLPLDFTPQSSIYRIKKIDGNKDEDIAGVITMMNKSAREIGGALVKLSNTPLNTLQAAKIIDRIIVGSGNKVATRTHNIRQAIYTAFKNGEGNNGETCLDLLNGLSEFVDHNRPTRVESRRNEADLRFESVISGSGASLKQKLFNILMERV